MKGLVSFRGTVRDDIYMYVQLFGIFGHVGFIQNKWPSNDLFRWRLQTYELVRRTPGLGRTHRVWRV